MRPLSKIDFRTLATFRSSPALSVYMPTHQSGVEVNQLQDAQLFKGILQRARKTLDTHGYKKGNIDALLAPAVQLLEDEDFWRRQDKGLAVFIGQGYFLSVKIPYAIQEELFIGPHFYVAPLFPLIQLKPFFLLTLSKGNARFFRGNQFGLEEIAVSGLPNGVNDVIRFEEKDGRRIFRRGGSKGKAAFHGQGAGLADETEYIAHYLKEVDDTLMTEMLAEEVAPLLPVGGDGILSQYREISRYPHLSVESVTGNYDHENTGRLFDLASKALGSYFDEEREKALANYFNHLATARTSSDPFKVIAASFYGKVDDLLIEAGSHIRGSFDNASGQPRFTGEAGPETGCLVNQAAVQTFMANGNVHLVSAEDMPEGSKIAAFMRYA